LSRSRRKKGPLDLARKQIKERDEFEAFEQAAIDLVRLDRYKRRAWSRQKRAIRAFMNLKLMRDTNERWSCAETLTRQLTKAAEDANRHRAGRGVVCDHNAQLHQIGFEIAQSTLAS